jgi:YidC/Oxa1 family membrane protein insertase
MAKTKLAKQNNDTGALTTNALKAQHLMKKHNANPFKGILGPAIQFPLALSFFFGIKAMCNLPVETMKTGGLWWFTDLTAADPYFVLPVLSAGAVIAMMRVRCSFFTYFCVPSSNIYGQLGCSTR